MEKLCSLCLAASRKPDNCDNRFAFLLPLIDLISDYLLAQSKKNVTIDLFDTFCTVNYCKLSVFFVVLDDWLDVFVKDLDAFSDGLDVVVGAEIIVAIGQAPERLFFRN